jgi:hypothetical protein
MQPERELIESKRKEKEEKWLSSAFVYFHLFFRIWTFQCVTSEKYKKIARLPTSRFSCGPGLFKELQPLVSRPVKGGAGMDFADQNILCANSDFVKRKSGLL